MHFRRVVAPVVVASVAAVSACGTQEPDPLAEVPAFPVDVARVEVVDPGNDPRVLTYNDIREPSEEEEDASVPVQVRVGEGFEQNVVAANALDPEAPREMELSEIQMDLLAQTQPAPEPGDEEIKATRRVDFTVDNAATSGSAAEVESGAGFLMSWRANDQGRVSTMKLRAPEEASDDARAAIEAGLLSVLSANVIFPSDPVGEGGSWTVESRVTGDATMLRTTTYTVTQLNDDSVALDVDVEERPAQETLAFDEQQSPDLAGQALAVENSSTVSESQVTVAFDTPVPVAGEVTAVTRVVYAGEQPDFRIVQDQGASVTYGG